MTKAVETLILGLTIGSLYALLALGYTMVYGTLKFINFAHSTVFMLGAWMSYVFAKQLGYTAAGAEIPWYAPAVVLLGVIVFCSTLGFGIERLAYKPLRSAPRLNVLITAIGVALFIENVAILKWFIGTDPARMPALIPNKPLFNAGGVPVMSVDVALLVLSLVFLGLLQWLVYGTRLGSAMRAVSQDTRTASLMGINVDRTISITFVVGSALAAVAGFLFAAKYSGLNHPAQSTWALLGLKAFVAAVVGGIGNLRGAVVGGILIGMLETLGVAYLSPHLRDVYVFTILIAVLLFLPTGLFGKNMVEKV